MSELRSALDGLAAVDVRSVPAQALGDDIVELVEMQRRLDGEIQRRIAAFDAQGGADYDGVASTQAWLRGRTRMAPREAAARTHTARVACELPRVSAALEAGEISFDHAKGIAMLAADTDIAATKAVEEQLLTVARILDPVRMGNELRAIRDAIKKESGQDPDDAYREAYERRRFAVVASFDGMFSLDGWLDAEGGATLKAALDPLTKPLPGDTRTPAQRCADAIVELARRELTRGDLPDNHGTRPQLLAVMQVEEVTEPGPAPTTAEPTEPSSEPAAGSTRLVLTNGRVIGGGCLSTKTLERLACDSTISRVLVNPQGEVLDLGRATRVVTPAQWKALVLRDGGCVIPGHDCPPAFTEAHHLFSWLRGGGTDIDGLALVCRFGHHQMHEGGFHLYLRDPDNRWIWRRPDGTEIVGQRIGETGFLGGSSITAMLNGPRGPCPD